MLELFGVEMEKMTAYYNEIDTFAAAWLRELIKAGHIAPGVVDERSIEDVKPEELNQYTQCHFFAGIGVWSYALRQAGWPDDRPVWTGSCPCQPFSSAGKGGGFDDERHLWPSFQWLIEQQRPTVVFGEQVASKSTGTWFDLVQADLEAMGYAFGCVPFPSAGVGAPHIRDRAYWVADTSREGLQGQRGFIGVNGSEGWESPQRHGSQSGVVCGLGNSSGESSERNARSISGAQAKSSSAWRENGGHDNRYTNAGEVSGVAITDSDRFKEWGEASASARHGDSSKPDGGYIRPRATNGIWGGVDWLSCRDGKWRPVESGTFPLVNGATSRVGRLRGYGNAINAEAAKVFIKSVMEV
jgi:DNA (cytosine-5)-methyltransferase 1